ncbi:unnamed protein product [Calypogeia fissa]
MLSFHEQVVGELVEEDGLVVMGAGLGLPKVVASVLLLQAPADGLVLILSSSDSQRQYVREELQAMDPNSTRIVEINNEFTSAERTTFYLKGGPYIITSRILIVDLLNERVPLQNVAGIIVANAHRITETCAEAFILRLYRQANRKGFVRAFTDRPQAMASGFSKTERIMKSLFVRRLYLWPRFQLSVSSVLEENPPDVVDIRMPLTSAMEGIQMAILEVMDACLKELRKTNKIDVEDLTVENGLFKSFDEIVRRQLDPIWHTVGRKTKQLVGDLNTLRTLAEYLLRYDAVTFLKYLDTLRISESARSVWIYATPTHRIFDLAKKRVYRIMRVDANGNPIAAPTAKPAKGGVSTKRKFIPESKPVVGFGVLNGVYEQGEKRVRTDSEVVDLTGDAVLKETNSNAETGNEQENSATASANSVGREAQGVELEVVVEEMPKWRILRDVLEEIEEERGKARADAGNESSSQDAWGEGCGAVLVACKDERTCLQLQGVITKGPEKLMREEWNNYLLGKAELQRIRLRGKRKVQRAVRGVGVYNGVVQSTAELKDAPNSAQKEEQDALLAAAAQLSAQEREVIGAADQEFCSKGTRGKGRGRGRGRGRGKASQAHTRPSKPKRGTGGVQESAENQAGVVEGQFQGMKLDDEAQLEQQHSVSETSNTMQGRDGHARPVEESRETMDPSMKPVPPVHYYALESEQRILDVIKPQYVIVYDPDIGFVRELEVFKAQYPSQTLKVYFLIYEDSTEGRKFEASIRRENTSFESLIRQKASMMIPVDQDGSMLDVTPPQSATGVPLNTRKAGGRKVAEKQMQVIVDMREFSSSLPCVLHQQGMRIIPVTLEVGDYILSPDICVERKSIADLYSSFSSGRLYHQAETMTRYYRLPVLLIEFSLDKSFSLQSASDVGEDILQANIISKLSLLVLHFPRLRIVWSRSLHATADIFASLKANQDEPDVERAMRVGVPTEDGLLEGDIRAENYNTTAVELLRRLPGVTDANYRTIMDGCKSLADLALMPVEQLATIMGGNRPARMLREFLDAKCPVL